MAQHDDPDDERHPGGPPLPPDDRLWRHPSELGPVAGPGPGAFQPPAPAAAVPYPVAASSNRRTSTRAALTGACLAGALVTLGVLFLTRPLPDGDLRRAPALRRAGSSVPAITSLTAPVASAASPIRGAQALPLATPVPGPGRLRIQVADDGGPVVVVTVEEGGPAHVAGVGEGDRIVSVNDVPVVDATDLSDSLSSTSAGETATVVVHRDGTDVTLSVVLG